MRRLKILWLSHFVPYPPKGGCFQRSYNLIKRVGDVHDVWLLALRHKSATHPAAEIANAREALLEHCRSVDIVDISKSTEGLGLARRAFTGMASLVPFNVSVYRSRAARGRIQSLCAAQRFDLVHFDTIGLAQYLRDAGDVPAVVTHHGAESHMIRRRIRREPNPIKKAYFVFEWLALRRYERLMCPRFEANIVMSEDDGRLMRDAAPDASYTPVGNGVDTGFFTPVTLHRRRTLIFAGRLDRYSNRDGILFFVNRVWPAVKARYPDVLFHVIGNNPPEALRKLAAADGGLKVHGFVADVRPYFAEASVAVCPLRDGGGTRIKILDALAQGIPIVSTTVGCEGIEVTPGRDVLIADTADQFVAQISRVFEEPDLGAALAREGRQLAEARYSWDSLVARLLEIYADVSRARAVA